MRCRTCCEAHSCKRLSAMRSCSPGVAAVPRPAREPRILTQEGDAGSPLTSQGTFQSVAMLTSERFPSRTPVHREAAPGCCLASRSGWKRARVLPWAW